MATVLEFPEREAVVSEAVSWPDRARAAVITDAETYGRAAELLKGIKALRQKIADTFDPHVKRAHEAHKALVKEKNDAETPLTQAERIIKDSLTAYDREQERLRAAEQRRLEDEARRAEEARVLDQAAAMELEGHAYGDDAMVAEASAMIEQPIAPPPVATIAKATPKVAGITYVNRYSARVTDLAALVRYVAAHPGQANLLTANMPALNGLAKSLRDGFKIPGAELVITRDVAASAR